MMSLIIDAHAHLWSEPSFSLDVFLKWTTKFGIDKLCVSKLTPTRPASVSGFTEANRDVAKAMKDHPDNILGYCYVNPCYEEEALKELRRCLEDHNMLGLKLYTDCHCLDPRVSPLIDLAVDFGAPILIHTAHLQRRYIGAFQSFHGNPPTVSTTEEIVELARRHPKATFIAAHIGGGGDWEWGIKTLRQPQNALLDTGGTGVDLGMIEMAVRELGTEKIVFGTDNVLCAGFGKVYGADISEKDREMILGGNMMRLLERRGIL